MTKLSDDESSFSALTRQPFAPFSAFINDLNRPFFLDGLRPSDEIVKTGVTFPVAITAPKSFPEGLFDCPSFNASKIVLNEPPVKEIAHEYDELMVKILEQCYESKPVFISESPSSMTIPNPKTSTPIKQLQLKKAVIQDTPNSLKVRLTVANSSSNSVQSLNKLIQDESFVNPLCFDCQDDLKCMIKIIRHYSESPPRNEECEIFASLASVLSKYMEEVCERLEENDHQIDSMKAMYSMLLIGFLNIERYSSNEALKSYNSFDLVMRLFALCDTSEGDMILSAVLDSYIGLLRRFKVHDSEVSSYISHLLRLSFEHKGSLSKIGAFIALSQMFSRYKDYRSYIMDQLLVRSSDTENSGSSKTGITLIISCLQALLCSDELDKISSLSSFLSSCLNFFWKGDSGTELPKNSFVFFVFIEELQLIYSDWHWPVAVTVLNQCTIQMFHYLLRDDASNVKGSLMLKLRFLDILANISKIVSLSASKPSSNEKAPSWKLISQNSWHSFIFSPKIAFECLNPSLIQNQTLDDEYYVTFCQSSTLIKIPERVTGLFIKLISSDTTQLRSKAIKNLFTLMGSAQLSKANYNALKSNILIKASDSSISVRDAVLEFISKLILTPSIHDDSQSDLIESVLLRIKDKGVSVRKRAVKIVGEILQKGLVTGTDLKILCISKLMSHIPDEDDETVIDSIFKTLKEQWIMCYIGKEFQSSTPIAQRKIMSIFAEEIIQIISSLQAGIKPLQDFLAHILKDESLKNIYSSFFSGTVEVLVESLLQSLERNELKKVFSSLESISLFSESNPLSLETHLGLLQSLLRSEDPDIASMSMKLIHCVLPKTSLTELKKLQDFEKDLLGLVYRGSEIAVKYSIETLYHYVNNCSHQYSTLSSLWQKFTDYLKSRMNDEEFEDSSTPHICRALIATGVLCAQSSMHREREFGLKDFHNGAQSRCLLEFISFYSRIPVLFIRSCTIQAFGSLLLACPQISVSSFQICKSLITGSLSKTENDLCKLKMLNVFDQMIQVFNAETPNIEESDNLSKNNILSMEGEENFFSALLQEHFNLVLNCVISCESLEIRAVSLKICSSAAILGLVNPQIIVPYLAIGLNSENEHIQAYSCSSYERLTTRFPTMIGKDMLTPSKLLFQQLALTLKSAEIDGFTTTNGSITPCSRLSFFYSSLKGKNGKSGIEALNGVFSSLEEVITRTSESSCIVEDECKFIPFLIGLIITLPFSSSDEVLVCLQKIQSIFSMSFDWIVSQDFIKEQFILLQGLSYGINYLIKSYPQISNGSLSLEDAGNGNNGRQSGIIQRIPFEFEFKLSPNEKVLSISDLQDFLSKQPSIPSLLSLQESKNRRRTQDDKTMKRIEAEENDDFDISGFLIDDDEISSESDTDESEEEDSEEYSKSTRSRKQSTVVKKSSKISKKRRR